MTSIQEDQAEPPRALVRALMALCGVAAVAAIGGGAALLLAPGDDPALWALLQHTPFETFLIPGLLLLCVVGGAQVLALVLLKRRADVMLDAAIFAGGVLTVWIVAEVAMFRFVNGLHIACGGLGLVTLAVATVGAWRSGRPRHRWLIGVTAGEALGFLAPTAAGLWSARAGMDGVAQWAALVAAGAVEGLVLGSAQGAVFPGAIEGRRFAVFSAAGAALAWSCFMGISMLVGSNVPGVIVGAGALVMGAVGLFSVGVAQGLALKGAGGPSATAVRWFVGWTALAWAVALPLSFAASPFVDESTPLWVHVVLWGMGGVCRAWVMALVTWQGARRL